jgi:hypothetical protein
MRGLQFNVTRGAARWARAAVAAAVLAVSVPGALAQTAPAPAPSSGTVVSSMPTGCWKVRVTPDSPSTVDGRLEFQEFIYFEGTTFTGQEISRLGFAPGDLTCGTNALGQTTFTVTLSSGTQGTVSVSGVHLTTTMSGTFGWTRDGNTYTYSFTGTPYTPAVDPES